MRIKRIALYLAVAVIFTICMTVMNSKFDRLSRYPYEDEEARKLIVERMSDEDIEFLIEYNIAPSFFMDYIKAKNFSVYHVSIYETTKAYFWYLNNSEVVDLSERVLNKYGIDEVKDKIILLSNYSYDEVNYYLAHGDEYIQESVLYDHPNSFDICLDDTVTISTHSPKNLMTNDNYTLRKEAYESLNEALNKINEEFNSKNYCGIVFKDSYLSYDELAVINKENNEIIPGHNMHQTGLCIDLDISSSAFFESANYVLFKDILAEYGFEVESCELSDCHLRYQR